MNNKRVIKNKRKQMKGRKKIYIKMWLEHLFAFLMVMSFSLIIMSVDSQWTLQYWQFVGINALICFISYKILKKYGRYYLQDIED
jgi:hypothetical protein